MGHVDLRDVLQLEEEMKGFIKLPSMKDWQRVSVLQTQAELRDIARAQKNEHERQVRQQSFRVRIVHPVCHPSIVQATAAREAARAQEERKRKLEKKEKEKREREANKEQRREKKRRQVEDAAREAAAKRRRKAELVRVFFTHTRT